MHGLLSAALLATASSIALQPKATKLAGGGDKTGGGGSGGEGTACSLGQQVRAEIQVSRRAAGRLAKLSSHEDAGSLEEELVCREEGAVVGGTPTVDFVSFVGNAQRSRHHQGPRLAVWVSSFPRSASSTVLSMISATVNENVDGTETFSLFEPCHEGDDFSSTTCDDLLGSISNCDFSPVRTLWGWANPHTSNGHQQFTREYAHSRCTSADIVAFKTVNLHDLRLSMEMVGRQPGMRVVDVVRDPRGIYASWKATPEFKVDTMINITRICEIQAGNLEVQDDRVHRVVFERLVQKPWKTTKSVYDFLGLSWGEAQESWVESVFHAFKCPADSKEASYMDCHSDTDGVKESWRMVLSQAELIAFYESQACRRVVAYYGFPVE